jgi:hypothetical protein
MDCINFITDFDDFFAFLISFFDGLHSDFDNLVSSKVGKERTVSKNIIEPDLIGFKLAELDVNDSAIDLFSQILKFSLINKAFLVVVFKFLFLVIEQKNCSPSRMNGLDDLRVVCFKLSNVSCGRLDILLDFLKHHFEVLGIKRECVAECVFCLLACLQHYYCDFVDKMDLLNEHSCDPGPNQRKTLKVHVKPYRFHAEVTAQYFKIV